MSGGSISRALALGTSLRIGRQRPIDLDPSRPLHRRRQDPECRDPAAVRRPDQRHGGPVADACWQQRDAKRWREVTHTIKGAARGVGAFAMGEAAAAADAGAIPAASGHEAASTAVQAYRRAPCADRNARHARAQAFHRENIQQVACKTATVSSFIERLELVPDRGFDQGAPHRLGDLR